MKRVIGIGGIFFRAKDPKALYEWYRTHLGIENAADGSGAMWQTEDPVVNVWAIFPQDTEYFGQTRPAFMVNFRVDDLEALLKALREESVAVDEKMEAHDYGKFGWVTDPEGNRVELWEPPKSSG